MWKYLFDNVPQTIYKEVQKRIRKDFDCWEMTLAVLSGYLLCWHQEIYCV